MSIEITKAVVYPIAWISDIYVNPSNNGNLQSASYKDLGKAQKRTNAEFIALLHDAIQVAKKKRQRNRKQKQK